MARIRVLPEANRQAREIDRWWKANAARSQLFAEEWKHARQRLRGTPLIGPPVLKAPPLHCLLLPGCQHYVYYRYDPQPLDEVVVVAVWSTRRGEPPPLPR